MGGAIDRIRNLDIILPVIPSALANYVPFVISGNFIFLSGQVPRNESGALLTGKVGRQIAVDEAYERAKLAGIQMLSVLEAALGSLDRVRRAVKIAGFINATSRFEDHPKVLDGCSDLLVAVFGESGRHARSVLGVDSLPSNVSLEIEAVFEITARD
jgi:enamine deaminase RidA (YjgF/YER057c/UK114 family)